MVPVILFGAGASHGSYDVINGVPPLGPRLFENLVERGGIAATLPHSLVRLFIENFELGMTEYFKQQNGNIMTFQRELAHYLAEFTPGENNVYRKLIALLEFKSVIYSSLNYDLLFELSAQSLGKGVVFKGRHENGNVRLLKIHGSASFWPAIGSNTFDNCTFSGSGFADVEAPVKILGQAEAIHNCKNQNSLAPAMAMYSLGKKVRTCPSFVDSQQQIWEKMVLKAPQVFVIGVRVNEDDAHIWKVLSESRAHVYYFGFLNDQDAFDKWAQNHSRSTFIESNFENSITEIKRLFAH